MSEQQYPAEFTVHWASRSVDCCDQHAKVHVNLAGFMGSHVGVTPAVAGSTCFNCENDAQMKAPNDQ